MIRTLLALAAGSALRGRDARIRTVLVAVSAGFAVALLLLAVSVPGALDARHARADARNPVVADAGSLVAAQVAVDLGSDGVQGLVLAPPSGAAPLPPGVTALPPAGAMLVSPALREELAGPDGPLLRARLPYRVVGTIGPAGLLGPSESAFLAVDPHLVPGGSAVHVQGFGVVSHPAPLDPVLTLLLVVGVLLLLVPIGIVVAVAGRFGAERRDRRLAAFRLLGLSSREVLVVALLEAGIAAVAGDLVGLAVFAAARQGIGGITIASLSVFPGDVVPPVPAAVLVLVLVPLLLGAAALAGLLALRVEPLGVARRASRRRRLRWRLVPPVLAIALLVLGVTNLGGSGGTGLALVGAGVALLLVGAVGLLPWLTERIAGAVAPGPLAWQVAMRRIRHDGTTTGRVVGAIAAVVAGAIALQLLFAGLAGGYTTLTGVQTSGTELSTAGLPPARAERMLALFSGSTGGPALAATELAVHGSPDRLVPVLTGDCRALARIAAVPGCRDGSSFVSPGGDARAGVVLEAGAPWRVPADAPRTAVPTLPNGDTYEGVVLVTPGALPLARQGAVRVMTIEPTGSAALLRTVRGAAAIDPALGLRPLSPTSLSHRFDAVRRGLTVGLVLVLLLIGLLLLVSVGEQLRERRRALAVLAVLGMPRGVLAGSVLAESALPVLLGALVAAGTGAGLGSALLAIVGRPAVPDPGVVLATAAVALVVPVLVTAASLPAALRLLRPEHLRTE